MPAPPHPAAGLLVAAVPLPGEAASDVAARDLDTRLRILARTARRVRRAGDDRAIHDLRVATRRLETALRLWSPLLAPGPARTALRQARKIRRAFTRVRDREMLRSEWRARARQAPPELRVVLESLCARVEHRLATATPKSRRRASPRHIARIARAIDRTRRAGPASIPRLSAPALADRQVRAMRGRALQALARGFTEGTDEALHTARVRVKKWRYAEECEIAIHKERSSSTVVEQLRELQDRLGRAHDLAVAGAACARQARKSERHGRPGTQEVLRRLGDDLGRDRDAAIAEAQCLATTLSRPDPLAARTADD